MKIKDIFDYTQSSSNIEPADGKIFLIGMAESEGYCNAITNSSSSDLARMFYSLYTQNPLFKESIDALRSMIEDDIRRRQIMGVPSDIPPVNTQASVDNAQKAIEEALKEVGAIFTGVNKSKS